MRNSLLFSICLIFCISVSSCLKDYQDRKYKANSKINGGINWKAETCTFQFDLRTKDSIVISLSNSDRNGILEESMIFEYIPLLEGKTKLFHTWPLSPSIGLSASVLFRMHDDDYVHNYYALDTDTKVIHILNIDEIASDTSEVIGTFEARFVRDKDNSGLNIPPEYGSDTLTFTQGKFRAKRI